MSGIVTISISLFIIILALLSFRVIGQFERGILLTFGRYAGTCNPGLITIIPFVQRLIRVDIRLAVNEIPQQDVITKDNVAVKVSAVAYYRVDNPEHAILSVENYHRAVLELAQITLRTTIGQHDLADLLSGTDKLNVAIAEIIAKRTRAWGVTIDHVEIRNVDIDPCMIRAMAAQAEASRGAQARMTIAEGELNAAKKLAEAAEILSANPTAMQLRTLSSMVEIGRERNSIIIWPIDRNALMPSDATGAAVLSSAVRMAEGTTASASTIATKGR